MEPSDTAALGWCKPCGVSFKMEYGCICSKFPPLLEEKTPPKLEQPAQNIKLEATEESEGIANVEEVPASLALSIPERGRARTPPITSAGEVKSEEVPISSQPARDQASPDTKIRVKLEQPIGKGSNTATVREAVRPPPNSVKTDTRPAPRPFAQPATQRPPINTGNGPAPRGREQTHAVFQPQGHHDQGYQRGPGRQTFPTPVAMNGGQTRFAGQGFGGPPNIRRGYGNEPLHWNSPAVARQNNEKMLQDHRDKIASEEVMSFVLRETTALIRENTYLKSQKHVASMTHTLTVQGITAILGDAKERIEKQVERIEELEESRRKWKAECTALQSYNKSLRQNLQMWQDQYEPGVNRTTGVQQINQQGIQKRQDKYEPGGDDAGLERRSYGVGTKRSWEESQDDKETHCEDPASTRKKRSRGDRRRRNREMRREEE